jgi:tripartite-type tricarboxylate transporter receptor subunit TctC
MRARVPFFAICIAMLAAALAQTASAQQYPVKPVRIIVPYLAGGAVDFVGRTLAQKLTESWGQPVVVENRPGAGSNLGAEIIARAPPDGYTLYVGGAANTVNVTLYHKLSFDFVKDLAPISLVTIAPNILVVHPSVPARSVKQLIALAKSKPGALNYASAGNASSNHLCGELFKTMAGVDIVHVPYKGGSGAVTALLSGEVTMYFGTMPSSLPNARAGRLRALAITSAKRSQTVPDLPTISESGLPGYDLSAWHGLFATAGTPPAVIDKLYREIARILALPEIRERMAVQGVDIVASTPAELAAYIQADIPKFARLVKAAGIQVD